MFLSRDCESKYSAVTSLLVVTSDSTSTAMSLRRAMASSSRSAGTRTVTKPLKSSDLSEETVQPPMPSARAATSSIEACIPDTTMLMSTVRTTMRCCRTSVAISPLPSDVSGPGCPWRPSNGCFARNLGLSDHFFLDHYLGPVPL